MNIRACTVLILSCGLYSIPTIDCHGTGRGDASQCFLESMLETERKSLGIENEVINLDEIKLHMLKTLLLYKRMDYIFLDKSILVDSNRAYCQSMSLGFKIEHIEVTRNSASEGHFLSSGSLKGGGCCREIACESGLPSDKSNNLRAVLFPRLKELCLIILSIFCMNFLGSNSILMTSSKLIFRNSVNITVLSLLFLVFNILKLKPPFSIEIT